MKRTKNIEGHFNKIVCLTVKKGRWAENWLTKEYKIIDCVQEINRYGFNFAEHLILFLILEGLYIYLYKFRYKLKDFSCNKNHKKIISGILIKLNYCDTIIFFLNTWFRNSTKTDIKLTMVHNWQFRIFLSINSHLINIEFQGKGYGSWR